MPPRAPPPDGQTAAEPGTTVETGGILSRHYGELVLTLAAEWQVRTFVYDWRKDLAIAASELETQIREWFPRGATVHLVAHGMGGLVGRLLAAPEPQRWAAMADDTLERGGRLIMLGTPNQGTPGVAAVLAGAATLVQKLAALSLVHTQAQLRDVFASFPSVYQLLPSPVAGAETDALYRAGTWG